MRAGTSVADETVRQALDRHQRRRGQGIPTLSVLIGSEEAATFVWKEWIESMGWPSARMTPWPGHGSGALEQPAAGAVLYVGATLAAEERTGQMSQIVHRLSQLLTAGPRAAGLAWAINVSPEDATLFLRDNAHSRVGAMFMEGMIALSRPSDAPTRSLPPDDTPAVAGKEIAFLTRIGASPATSEGFRSMAEACRLAAEAPQGEDETGDRARSAAERFLFDLLDDLPDTAGLFELNVRLGFCFGPMPAEVDLLSARLGLAVEIDGFYHFRDAENYRRDRRKDALLQKQGYLVLRFLAEDVVARLEDIVEEIRAAVAFRRATR